MGHNTEILLRICYLSIVRGLRRGKIIRDLNHRNNRPGTVKYSADSTVRTMMLGGLIFARV
jgi:hypothetical protein